MPDPQREYWAAINTELAMADYGAAQTWIAEEDYTLTEVWLRMANSSPAYEGTLTLDLYSVSGGEPDTKIATLWSGSVNSWGSVQTWRYLTGISQAITNGVIYAYVVNLNPLRDATHYIRWSGKSGYAGGIGYQENTDEVYTNAGIDFHFVNYGTGAVPSKATNPTPAHQATQIDFSALVLSWDDGGGADTFDVYMGPSGNLSIISSAQAGTTLTVDTADVPWGERIYWRIDSTNGNGTTTGDTWYFDIVLIRTVKLGANGAFIVVTAKDGVYLSTDSGANWSRKTPDAVEDTDWVKGICSSTGTYIVVVSSANAIYRSANSGTAWAAITPAGGDTFSVSDLATSDDGQFMVIVGTNSTDGTESCYVSTNYGVAWTAYKPVDASVAWTECDISNDGTIITVATSSHFYISLDSGTTWLEQGMASTAENWIGLSISGDGTTGLIANTSVNDEFFIGTKTDLYSEATWAEASLTSAGRALLDDADAAAQAVTLGLEIGVDIQAWDAQLDDISALAVTDGNFMVGDDSNWVAESGNTARTSLELGTGDSPTFAGLTVDTDTLVVDSSKVTIIGPSFPLASFERQISSTSGAYAVNRFQATSTGNMSNTFGPFMVFSIEDNAAVINDIALIGAFRDGGDLYGRFQIRTKGGGGYHSTGFNIDPFNKVGMGTTNPIEVLHIYKSQNDITRLKIENPNAGTASATGFNFENDAGDALCFFYSSGHASNPNLLYFKNEVGDVSFVAESSSSIGFGLGTTAAHAINLVIANGGNVGFGETAPETLLEMTDTTPYITLHNSTHEDTDGGRESRLNFKGEQSGGEETTLARIEVGHDGAVDDEKGKVVISVNDGNDGDTPTEALTIDSTRNIKASGTTFCDASGNLSSANGANFGPAGVTSITVVNGIVTAIS